MKYFGSIRTKLLLAITAILFVFLLMAMGGMYLFQKDALTKESIKKLTELDSVLKTGLKSQMVTHSSALTQTMVNEIKSFKNISDIYIINTDGVVKFSPDQNHIGTIFNKNSIECRQCHHDVTGKNNLTLQLKNSHGDSILRNVTHIYNEASCFPCHPPNQKILGLLFVDYSTADTDAQILAMLWRFFLTAVATFIVITIVILLITNRLIHKPIALLIGGTNDIKNGNYERQIQYEGNSELTMLADSFNEMSEKLRISRDLLEQRILERTSELNISNEQLAREIVEHRKAEETLRDSEESNRLLLQAASDGIFGVNTAGEVTFVNHAASEMLGFTADEMLGQSVHTLIHHSHTDGSNYALEDCPMYASYTYGTTNNTISEALWCKDGSSFSVEYSSTPITKDGKVKGAVVIFKDITKRKQTEQALEDERIRLQNALDEIMTLRGIVPICQYCKKIRDDAGYWSQVEQYVSKHTAAQFSHGICPTCFEREMKEIKGMA